MKKLILAFALASGCLVSDAQNCNIGNNDSAGFTNTGDPFWADYLLGVHFTLGTPGILNSINMLGRSSGSQVQMGVYADNGGVPSNLIATGNITTVGGGVITCPVAPVQLAPGDYWIMAVYSQSGGHVYNGNDPGNTVYYTSLNFGSPLPANGSGFTSYTGLDIAYFLGITCGTLGENENTQSEIRIYPNPAKEGFYFSPVEDPGISSYFLTDLSGRTVIPSGTLSPPENSVVHVSLEGLEPGIYFLNLETGSGIRCLRLVKE